MKATPRVKLTYEDFLLFPDDGKRHELIDGDHYLTPCPNVSLLNRHQVPTKETSMAVAFASSLRTVVSSFRSIFS